jgi:translation initiation factor 3 subunit D
MDKLTTKQEKLLQDGPLVFPPTAKEDEILMDLMNGNDERIVVATESVLSMLMTCTKSIYPWDIMVTKKGNSIRLDKRNGGVVDYISVNENASETPLEGDGMNCRQALSVEATKLQKEVRDVIKSSDEIVFQPMPEGFSEGVIKYRKFWMDTFSLVVRGSCHFALQGKGGTLEDVEYSTIPESETSLVNCYALNEYEKVGIEYRRGLDHQRGAILASELKNNWVKIARYMLLIRWVTECELVGVETMKLAFVSRSGFKDRKKHVLLGIVTERTDTIMQKMGMEMSNGYGILKALVDLWFGVTVVKNGDELQVVEEGGLEDGNYCVVKDPYKSVLYVYRVDESE